MSQTDISRKRSASVNPVAEGIKIVLGSSFGLFFAVLLLSCFWDVDILGMKKKKPMPEVVATASPAPAKSEPAPSKSASFPVGQVVTRAADVAAPKTSLTPPAISRGEIESAIRSSSTPRPPMGQPAADTDSKSIPPDQARPPEPERSAPAPTGAGLAPGKTEQEPNSAPAPAPAAPEPTAEPKAAGESKGAWLVVARQRPWQIPRNLEVPEFLENGIAFIWQEKPKSVNTDLATIEFVVNKTGVVVLGESWKIQGNDGGWKETAMTREKLIEQGWAPCGTIQWPPVPAEETQEVHLLQKVCKKGEVYKIRTNKYWPPYVFVPPIK